LKGTETIQFVMWTIQNGWPWDREPHLIIGNV